mmetsp:Transcript_28721/g.73679  ORF Transcript_28721/g.73679 Transcript_28721/m.73679 type:complete len:217 (+) Transcript_28721:1325-1975(+)
MLEFQRDTSHRLRSEFRSLSRLAHRPPKLEACISPSPTYPCPPSISSSLGLRRVRRSLVCRSCVSRFSFWRLSHISAAAPRLKLRLPPAEYCPCPPLELRPVHRCAGNLTTARPIKLLFELCGEPLHPIVVPLARKKYCIVVRHPNALICNIGLRSHTLHTFPASPFRMPHRYPHINARRVSPRSALVHALHSSEHIVVADQLRPLPPPMLLLPTA